jgi:hypothetical protein
MNATNHIQNGERGSVLLAVLGYLFLSVGMVLAIVSLSSNHRKVSQEQVTMEQAMFVAEAGIERGARFMESNLTVIVGSSTGATNGSGSVGSGTFTYSIIRSNSSTYNLVSTGTVNGVSRVIKLLRIYQPSYAEFAFWTHVNGAIYFKDGEVFDGHVHADDQLYFDASGGGPVFHAAVTSNAGTYTVKNGSITDIEFDQGLTLNSYQGQMADVDFNSSASTSMKNTASSSGLLLSGTTTLTFNGTSVSITNTRKSWSNHTYNPSTEGIIYIANATSGSSDVAGIAYLKGGNVTGRLTVVTESDMYVRGNITYTTDPRTTSSSTDALGMISQADIWVDTTAPNNLEIDAAMIANGTSGSSSDTGSFGVINYNTGSPRGNLTIYGGIVQDQRGAVGTFSGSSTTHGYAKQYGYDPRFINTPPPYYPTIANKVTFSNWQEGR